MHLLPPLIAALLSADPPPEEAPPLTLGGYVEAYYQWNAGVPSNGITNFRGFDNRHNSFTLANAAVDAQWDKRNVVGRVTLQIGSTPSTYYLAEPSLPGTTAANATGAELWKYLQQANAGYRFDVGRGLLVSAGLFLSPVGVEAIAVKDNWNFSRSNLFFGLPFYHAGIRGSYELGERWSVVLGAYNGWNSVVDNNRQKSLAAQVTYRHSEQLSAALLYFGGVERPEGAPEGEPWRHLFDAYATYSPNAWLSFIACVDAGFEQNTFGTSSWYAGALYGRVKLLEPLFLAARGDSFHEQVPDGAAAIFWPVSRVSSATATVDYRPVENASIRIEYRRDMASGEMFFGGASDVPNRRSQDTVTLGATTWL